MPPEVQPETLWALSLTWPCDYAEITREPEGKKAPLKVSVHLEKCRRCTLQKLALLWDERLKHMTQLSWADWVKAGGEEGYDYNSGEDDSGPQAALDATKEHAQFIRDDLIGAPMNPDTNTFYVADEPLQAGHIPFTIGEELEIKGHVFVVEFIDIPKNPAKPHLLVLRPVRKTAKSE
jgi:hypothetical protein